MREGYWAVAVLLLSLLLQVQATYPPSEYYRGGECPFRADEGGGFTAPELSPIAGVPGTDPNFLSYLLQQLCKGCCHKPENPLTTDDNILDMQELNSNFKCENKDIRLNGDDVLKSWNAQVQKPVCEVVGETKVCIVNTVQKTIYVNIFLLICSVTHKIFVVSPGETFGNFKCYLTPNLYATLVHDVFEVSLLSNPNTNAKKSERPNLVFAPERLGKEVLTYLNLWHAMPDTKTLPEYDHLLKKWRQVCGENSGHNTTAVCKSMTAEMAKVCKKVLTDKDRDEIAGIKTCVNDFYKGMEKSTKHAQAHEYWCGLNTWEMDQEMTRCVNSKSNPMTPKEDSGPLAFISSIGSSISYMGQALSQFFWIVCNAVSFVWNLYACANSWVSWVFQLTIIPIVVIVVAWVFEKTAIFTRFWALMSQLYNFTGELEKAGPGSKSIWDSISYYWLRLLVLPWSFCRKLEVEHEGFIDKNLAKKTEAVKTEYTNQFEVTRQQFSNLRGDLRSIEQAIALQNLCLKKSQGDSALRDKLYSEIVPTIDESMEEDDAERWRAFACDGDS